MREKIRTRRIYLNIWPRRRVSKALLNGGMFYIQRQIIHRQPNEWGCFIGHQDDHRRHETRISEDTYKLLARDARIMQKAHVTKRLDLQ